jgi:altronate dehydratase
MTDPPCFAGFPRQGNRGVGTRNYLVILAATSEVSSFAKVLAERLSKQPTTGHLDGIVPVCHTEGAGSETPNNLPFLLRTLAGFLVHPNVGAALVVFPPSGQITRPSFTDFLDRNGYPSRFVEHHFLVVEDFNPALVKAERVVRDWLPALAAQARVPVSLSHLRLALQCGGSDAFSGISANPLVGLLARAVVRSGGFANLAETDELVGAESYLLSNVRDQATAEKFLEFVKVFSERMRWHGHSPEGNPSSGNRFRGLYNIALKSLGAAMKRPSDVRLDYVIDYAEPMREPGYYFMNSPGNDLESVAGQVAAGSSLIVFTTGNGSITNFPFVPTLKVMSNTPRYELLTSDMDINAGRYLDGVPLSELELESFESLLETASGRKTKGELAGHSQVSIWRNWRQNGPGPSRSPHVLRKASPLTIACQDERSMVFDALPDSRGIPTVDQLGLIVPSSLCSSQVSSLFVQRLNREMDWKQYGISGLANLPHSEGCGVSGGHSQKLLERILIGYLTHPVVRCALVLEHGCEKVHNQYLGAELKRRGISPDQFGWASIQLDGGIERAYSKVRSWFLERLSAPSRAVMKSTIERVALGLLSSSQLGGNERTLFRDLVVRLASKGTPVVTVENDPTFSSEDFQRSIFGLCLDGATLAFAEPIRQTGFHVMATHTSHWVETLTGLGATGVQIVLTVGSYHARQGHLFLPTLQVGSAGGSSSEFDFCLEPDSLAGLENVMSLIEKTASRLYTPVANARGNVSSQVTRGPFGISV